MHLDVKSIQKNKKKSTTMSSIKNEEQMEFAVVGDGAVGKSAISLVVITCQFSKEYDATSKCSILKKFYKKIIIKQIIIISTKCIQMVDKFRWKKCIC